MKTLLIRSSLFMVLTFYGILMVGQVYPYAYFPDKGISKNKKYGLVSDNKKITEPIFDEIKPFLNQKVNQYTLYYKVDEKTWGIINKKGEVIPGIDGKELKYDGNGKILIAYEGDLIKLINIETQKTILETKNIDIKEVVSGDKYYIILYDYKSRGYSVIDEKGEYWSVKTEPYQDIKFLKYFEGNPVFEVKMNRNAYKYYNGEGEELNEDDVFNDDDEDDFPAFVDLSIESNEEEIQLKVSKDVSEEHPECQIGQLFKDRYGEIRLVEIINRNGKRGLTKTNGEIVVNCEFVSIRPIYSDFDGDEKDDKYYLEYKDYNGAGIVAIYGKVIFKPKFGFIQFVPKANLFSLMAENQYWGYGSNRGTVFLPKECNCLD